MSVPFHDVTSGATGTRVACEGRTLGAEASGNTQRGGRPPRNHLFMNKVFQEDLGREILFWIREKTAGLFPVVRLTRRSRWCSRVGGKVAFVFRAVHPSPELFLVPSIITGLCGKNMMAILGFTTFGLKEFASYLLRETLNFVNVLTVRFFWVCLIS